MGNIVVVEATQHMQYGIGLADVGEELVAETLTFGGALNKTCYVYNLHCGGYHRARVAHFDKTGEAVVGDSDYAHIGFDCAKRKVCRLRLGVRQTVEKSGFAYVGQSYYAAF